MLRSLAFYTALFLGVNGAFAGTVDWDALREAGMSKLAEVNPPVMAPDIAFTDRDGGQHKLEDWRGKVLLVNFWATWCAPCREEMPSLDLLQAEMGGDDFEVLTIAAGRNPLESIDKFFDEVGLENLPVLRDERQHLARAMGVMGLPVTILIDREGHEVARLLGEEDWAGEPAKELIRQLMGPAE